MEHHAICDECGTNAPMCFFGSTDGKGYWTQPDGWLELSTAPHTTNLSLCSVACLVKWCEKRLKEVTAA